MVQVVHTTDGLPNAQDSQDLLQELLVDKRISGLGVDVSMIPVT